MRAPTHPDEAARLAALARLQVLDTPPEERFDRITRLASTLLGTPIALVSLVDADRQWFKSVVGLPVRETARDLAFCAHAVSDPCAERLIVTDAQLDARFRDNPLVTDDPRIRFYAGHVLHAPGGQPVGTLCVIDREPRELDERESAILADLAAMAEDELVRTSEVELLLRLDASERDKGTLLDALDEGLILYDPSGRAIQWNGRAEEMLGLTGSDLSDRPISDDRWDVLRADGTPLDPADFPVAEVLRTGRPVLDRTLGLPVDGERRWFRTNCRPILDASGHPTSVVAAFDDITEQLEVRATSAAQTERLRAAIDRSPLGTALTDSLGRFTYLNEAYARLLAIDAVDAVGRPSMEFVHPDDVGVGADDVAALIDGRRSNATIELRVRDAVGRTKHVRTHVARLRPATASAAYLIQIEDVTEQRDLAEALRRSEEFSRVALEGLDEGVFLVDRRGTVRLMNSPAERILATDTATLTRQLQDHGTPVTTEDGEAIPHDQRVITRVLRTREAVRGEIFRWPLPDGGSVLLRVACLPTTLDDGSIGAVVSFADVTEERRLELELERYGILFEHADDIITVVDADGHVQYASPSVTRVLGYAPDWSDPSGVLGLVHPDDVADATTELTKLVADERGEDAFTVRVRAASGEWRHLECVGVNLLHEPSVRGVVLTARDVTERQHLLEQLAHRATHDLLTDLPNRSVLTDQLVASLARAERSRGQIALCYLDLDGFKQVNDTRGHAAGDQILREVARRLTGAIRTGDTPGRIGGDEFVVVLDPVRDAEEARRIAHRLRDAVVGGGGLGIDDVTCGVSVGIAVSRPGDDADSLAARADAALYASKSRGGCAVEVAAA